MWCLIQCLAPGKSTIGNSSIRGNISWSLPRCQALLQALSSKSLVIPFLPLPVYHSRPEAKVVNWAFRSRWCRTQTTAFISRRVKNYFCCCWGFKRKETGRNHTSGLITAYWREKWLQLLKAVAAFPAAERIFYSGGIIHFKLRSHLGTESAHLSSLRKERRQEILC